MEASGCLPAHGNRMRDERWGSGLIPIQEGSSYVLLYSEEGNLRKRTSDFFGKRLRLRVCVGSQAGIKYRSREQTVEPELHI